MNGAPMDAREVELRQQVKKALEPKGALKSVRHVFDEFERYGAMKPPTDFESVPLWPLRYLSVFFDFFDEKLKRKPETCSDLLVSCNHVP